jgi:3-hydroxyisobutyrate dehydrogenase-like beta-hydroxyacid dehydrogenase
METIGFIGVGKIGLPICQNLIKSGRTVFGYRRGSLAEFEKAGGIPAKSPKELAAQSDIIFTCLPTDDALEEVVRGPNGIIGSVKEGHIVVEFGSHAVPFKQQFVDVLGAKGAIFLDGEVSGTPTMIAARKGVIYLAGDETSAKKIEPVVEGFADLCMYLGAFGAATTVKLVNNLLVGLHIAGAAQALAIGLKAGVDPALLIKAVATGSGGSTQFSIRAPWMAERRFLPQQGSAPGLAHYLEEVKGLAESIGVATPLIDFLIDIYARAIPAIGERDVAALIEFFEAPRA